MAKYVLKLNNSRIQQHVGGIGYQAATRAANKLVTRVKQEITAADRIDTGAMRAGVQHRPTSSKPLHTRKAIFTPVHYVRYQNEGTGGSVARPGGVLVFTPKGTNTVVFAKRVRGIQPARFFEKALASVDVKFFMP